MPADRNNWLSDTLRGHVKKMEEQHKKLLEQRGCEGFFPICWDATEEEWIEIPCGSEFSGKIRFCNKCKEKHHINTPNFAGIAEGEIGAVDDE